MISRFEQARYAAALGTNPTAQRDLVIRLLQDGKTSDELMREAGRSRARAAALERGTAQLHTPEARRKRGRATERAWADGRMGAAATARRKLGPEQVRTMRRLRADGYTYPEIARRYGISAPTVRSAVLGLTYADVAESDEDDAA